MFALVYKEACLNTKFLDPSFPSVVCSLLQEYEDIFPEESQWVATYQGNRAPNSLSWSNYSKPSSLQMQSRRDQRNSMASSKLMEKGYVTESLSSYVVLVLLVPKKDGSWRMCNDYRAMNNITVKQYHLIPRSNDMLDELHWSCIFF